MLYAAYGSNLNLDQMAGRCPTAKLLGKATLEGYRLLFKGGDGSAVATIEPAEGYTVPLLIWDCKREDMEALDRYEGFPRLYRKMKIDLNYGGKTKKTAVAYVMNGKSKSMPSRYYYNVIREGYEENGLPMKILEEALVFSADY